MFKKAVLFFVLMPLCLIAYDKVILHFDVNKTLIAIDSAKKQDLAQVLDDLKIPAEEQTLITQKLRRDGSLVFRSFYKLLCYLQQNKINYTIVIRSFGTDIPLVLKDISQHLHPHPIWLKGHYNKGHFFFSHCQADTKGAYQLLKKYRFVAIRDDYEEWHNNKRLTAFGKKFMIDEEDKNTLSLFFDDNISFGGKSIVAPVDLQGYPIPTSDYLVTVKSREAMLDDDYYVNIVKKKLCKPKSF